MLVTSNLAGTSAPSFKLGKNGPTIFQGTASPTSSASEGDLYIQTGSTPAFFQFISGSWASGGFTGGSVNGDIAIINGHKLTLGNLALLSSQALTIANNQASPTTLFFYTASGNESVWMDYGLRRGSDYEMGTMMILNDGTNVDFANQKLGIGDDAGVTFSVTLGSGVVAVNYTSTNTTSGTLTANLRQSPIS